ncbi:MAG: hypothetical protein K8L99_23575 [Anaerolineae bacterium]|nr:hypothetical protein [Anaerolineae bacterium]
MVGDDLTIYIEEVYDGWIAQHAINCHGEVLASVDEDFGRQPRPTLLSLPARGKKPTPPTVSRALNFHGPRQQGMREDERIADMVRPLSIESKLWLTKKLALSMPPFLLLGVAESHVLAEARLLTDEFVVCRRLRLAYALQQPKIGTDQQPYDYDTLVLYVAHLYNGAANDTELPVEQVFLDWPEVDLQRPVDCLVYQDHLFIAECGMDDKRASVHVWQIQRHPEVT